MKNLDTKVLFMAATFLDAYRERLSNDGCNDMDDMLRKSLTDDEWRQVFSVRGRNWCGSDDVLPLSGLNHFVAGALSDYLDVMAERKETGK